MAGFAAVTGDERSSKSVLTATPATAMIRTAPVGSKGASQTDSPGSLFLGSRPARVP
jgi:hypothetical protein